MYGKLNLSVASPSSRHALVNPTRKGWSIPAPAPCATTMVANGDLGRAYFADIGPFTVSIRSDSSGSAIACHDARDGRLPPPRHLGLLLRRLETRRLLSRRAEEPRDADLLLAAAIVGRDQLHLPPLPLREVAQGLARAGSGQLHLHPQSEPADHALQATRRHRWRRPGVPRAREASRGQARVRPVPVPAVAALRPGADRSLRGLPPTRWPLRDGVQTS